jgi:hypothetical protein
MDPMIHDSFYDPNRLVDILYVDPLRDLHPYISGLEETQSNPILSDRVVGLIDLFQEHQAQIAYDKERNSRPLPTEKELTMAAAITELEDKHHAALGSYEKVSQMTVSPTEAPLAVLHMQSTDTTLWNIPSYALDVFLPDYQHFEIPVVIDTGAALSALISLTLVNKLKMKFVTLQPHEIPFRCITANGSRLPIIGKLIKPLNLQLGINEKHFRGNTSIEKASDRESRYLGFYDMVLNDHVIEENEIGEYHSHSDTTIYVTENLPVPFLLG